MDDDIRDRFRGVSRSDPTPTSYGRSPTRPQGASVPRQQAAKPIDGSAWPSSALNPTKAEDSAPSPSAPPKLPQKPKPAKRKKRKEKRSKKKKFLIFLIWLLIIGAIAGGAYYAFTKKNQSDQDFQKELTTPQDSAQAEVKPTGTIRFIAVGDSLAYESINNAAKQPDGSYNYLPMTSGFKPFFEKTDIGLCNQTTPGGGDKNGLAISGYPTFNAPLSWSSGFAGLGCNVINLASEHINDKGQVAIHNTLATWDANKVLAIDGANRTAEEQAKIRYFTVKGLKFAYLAYTTKSANAPSSAFSVNIYSDETANKQITEARKNAQQVIVSMNWGAEDSLDVNADQERIAQNLANQNVDVVVGGGPRVVQPAKILNGNDGHQTLVWFSLGNFLGSALPINNLIGAMAIMDFDAATQQIKDPKLMPVYMHYEWTAAQRSSGNLSARNGFMLWPLDLAGEPLGRSLNNTTVEAQTTRITNTITKFLPIKVIKSTEF